MPGPVKYVPVLMNVTLGRGGVSRGIFDSEETDPIDFEILVTEADEELTDDTTEANLAP